PYTTSPTTNTHSTRLCLGPRSAAGMPCDPPTARAYWRRDPRRPATPPVGRRLAHLYPGSSAISHRPGKLCGYSAGTLLRSAGIAGGVSENASMAQPESESAATPAVAAGGSCGRAIAPVREGVCRTFRERGWLCRPFRLGRGV